MNPTPDHLFGNSFTQDVVYDTFIGLQTLSIGSMPHPSQSNIMIHPPQHLEHRLSHLISRMNAYEMDTMSTLSVMKSSQTSAQPPVIRVKDLISDIDDVSHGTTDLCFWCGLLKHKKK